MHVRHDLLFGGVVCWGWDYEHKLPRVQKPERGRERRGEEGRGLLFTIGRAPDRRAEGLSGNLARALQSSRDGCKWS